MKKREKYLLGGLLAFFFLWQGQSLIHDIFIGPIADRERKIRDLDIGIGKKKVTEREIDAALALRKTWAKRSLPPDPSVASTLYQNWLIDLATKAKLENALVTPGRVDPGRKQRPFTQFR